MRSRHNSGAMLDVYHKQVEKILEDQHPVTGLVARNDPAHPYHRHAWIRDNVYASLSVWGLSLAYRKCTTDKDSESRVNYLERSVMKLMRGLLTCISLQADKLEAFKKTQNKYDCLHAKFDAANFKTVVGDYEWGHLQVDAVALYLLMLAQMTVSGLQIIFNQDEVAVVQNICYYLEQAYRTPDFGIWERGDKTNRGHVELNASSIGMAKAALQAIHSIDLFGARGSSKSVVTCMPDEITQCNAVLESLLPRESNSKEVDLSLLTIITYPAFAVNKQELIQETRNSVLEKLKGNYGLKRFLRDGYKTVIEDPNRLYYDSHELKYFENIECEWPLGFCFLLLDALFRGDNDTAELYRQKLDKLMIESPDSDFNVLPEFYYVPSENIEQEKLNPGSQTRLPGGKVPHLWSHSIWIICSLISDGLLTVGEMDPLNRRLASEERPDVIVQVVAVAETTEIQKALHEDGFEVNTVEELSTSMNMRIFHANVLSQLFTKLGDAPKLGLTGRFPYDYIGIEATSKFYRVKDSLLAFVPFFYNKIKFYLALDNKLMLSLLTIFVQFLKLNWRSLGRPTMIMVITKNFLDPESGKLSQCYYNTLTKCRSGMLDGLRVAFGNMEDFRSTSSLRRLGFLEKIIDETSVNPLEHHDSILGRNAEGSVIRKWSSFHSDSLSRKMSAYRTISTTRNMAVPVKVDKKSSAATQFLKPQSSTQQLLNLQVTREEIDKTNEEDLMMLLCNTSSLQEQLDVLVFFHNRRGLDFRLKIGEDPEKYPTVAILLKELYQKASDVLAWSILRYSASMLRKLKDNIAAEMVDILVRQKTLTIGLPPEPRERSINRPMPQDDLHELIYTACGDASPLAAFSQEIIIFISLLIRTQPQLFDGMMRVRIGLIIQVLSQEIARSLNVDFDTGMDHLLRMEPYMVYELLHQLLAGKEIKLSHTTRVPGEGQSDLVLVRHSKKDMSRIKMTIADTIAEDEEDDSSGSSKGTWLRRRRVDGSLNRVPLGFYQLVWRLLDKCQEGISVEGHMLYAGWTQEMTLDELKFALQVEAVFSRLSEPEYRQVLIEALMVLASLVEHHYQSKLAAVVKVEDLARHANHLFLAQLAHANPQTDQEELPRGIKDLSFYLYDSAPSGRFGTLTYLTMASVMYLEAVSPTTSDKITCKVT